MAGAGTVLHLAAATRALDADTFHRVNAEGTARLVRAVESEGGDARLVYLSSLAAVGPARDGPVGPDTEPAPLTPYGRSKRAGERAVLESGLNAAVIRAPAVYGPGDRDLLPFFTLARIGILPVAGSGARRVQLVHARDLAAAVLAGADARGAAGVYHAAEPRSYAWGEVLARMADAVESHGIRVRVPAGVVRGAAAVTEWVSRLTRRPVIFDRDKARELLAEWLCETDAARRDLGFEAAVPLAEGLRETVAWYRAYGWL